MMTLDEIRTATCAAVTIKDAASVLGVNPRTLSGALSVHGGDIPARRIGRRVVIPREAFLEWLDGERARPVQAVDEASVVDDAVLAQARVLVEALAKIVGGAA